MLDSRKIETRLEWEGKRTKVDKVILPFQLVEIVNEPRKKTMDMFVPRLGNDQWHNMLIWGDNKLIMSSLLPKFGGKIDLIYIDPPFATGADFTMDVEIENESITKQASAIEVKAYRDTWGQGITSYLQMIYDRLALMRELLAEDGSLYVHLDWRVGHYVKILLDEIFGKDNFLNCIVWRRQIARGMKVYAKHFGNSTDSLLLYGKNSNLTKWNPVEREILLTEEEAAAKYSRDERGFFRTSDPGTYTAESIIQLHREGRIYVSNGGELIINNDGSVSTTRGKIYVKYYRERRGNYILERQAVDNFWEDIPGIAITPQEYLGFPTQKPEALLQRIISASSDKGDIVADFFCGSGTTLAVAEKLGRRWIGADLSKFAIHIARKRLLEIPGCQFQVLNLGRYQKQKLMENGNGGKKYIEFILQLYHASPLQGFAYIHGKKGSRLVHIGGVDSFVSEREIRETSRECLNVNAKGLDVLGWDFEMGLHDLINNIEREYAIDIQLKQIPLEVLELKSEERSKLDYVKFFDLNYLDVGYETKGREITVFIKKFVIANPEYIPEEIRNTVKNFSSFIDYWAVDFDYKGDTFHNMRQEYRSRKNSDLRTRIKYEYEKPGEYDILVKVIDILGNDTNKLIHVKVE
jgi:adenine-specific DNA-methyltransferase